MSTRRIRWRAGYSAAVPAKRWLPGLLPQSVLRDVIRVKLPSLVLGARRAIGERAQRGKESVAAEWRAMLASGEAKSRAELARKAGVTRARVTQMLGAGTA